MLKTSHTRTHACTWRRFVTYRCISCVMYVIRVPHSDRQSLRDLRDCFRVSSLCTHVQERIRNLRNTLTTRDTSSHFRVAQTVCRTIGRVRYFIGSIAVDDILRYSRQGGLVRAPDIVRLEFLRFLLGDDSPTMKYVKQQKSKIDYASSKIYFT